MERFAYYALGLGAYVQRAIFLCNEVSFTFCVGYSGVIMQYLISEIYLMDVTIYGLLYELKA